VVKVIQGGKMKLHICCGDVYLEGYVNIDVLGEIGETKGTTLEEYYTRPLNTDSGQGKIIVDRIMDITRPWAYSDNVIDEILIVCGIEHFTKRQGEHIIGESYRVLKYGGALRMDFPDIHETVKQYSENPEHMVRLLYGSGKNPESTHKWGYSKETMLATLKTRPWESIYFGEIVKHDYPMIGVEAVK